MTKKQVYTTNLIIAFGFGLIGFLTHKYWLFHIAAIVITVTILHYKGALAIANIWMWIGKTLGNFNAKITLSAFFFLLLWPLSAIKKLLGKKTVEPTNTNWKTAKDELDFTKPF
jgi:hypothetical protein